MGFRTKLALVAALVLAGFSGAAAQDTDYTEYKRTKTYDRLFQVVMSKHEIAVSFVEGDATHRREFKRDEITRIEGGALAVGGETLFDVEGLVIDGLRRNYDMIHSVRVTVGDKSTRIAFLTVVGSTSRSERLKKGNLISYDDNLTVDDDEFIRGHVITISGDVEVYGEVNKDVVSLFGDIYLGPAAVARGDVVSATGRVDVARDASVYGEISSPDERRSNRSHRFYRRTGKLNDRWDLRYNRVDGLSAIFGYEYDDKSQWMPKLWGLAGYAFGSDRWRYDLGFEQAILRSPELSVGGHYSALLASGDDWLLDDCENSVFSALVKEDYKDYWEAERASAYIKAEPHDNLSMTVSYNYEETTWLEANHNLWSLFKNDHRFRDNYSSVDSSARAEGIAALDDGVNVYLSAEAKWDTRRNGDRFRRSSWAFTGDIEYANPDFSSDFDYTRYTASLTRYQKLSRKRLLRIRAIAGGSDGTLPMHRQFYLGGLGTVHGYDHKEYRGTEFWMVNAEYRVRFPASDIATSLVWDVGQIDNKGIDNGRTGVKHALGVGVYLGDDIRLNLARRLDRSSDNDPIIYVRLDHVF